MKGVILSRCPDAHVVDLAHDILPGDVAGAAFALAAAAPHFPPGAVHVAVVDPGVGTARRGLALELGGQRFVGPDNGIFGLLLADAVATPVPRAHALENAALWRAPVSPVFHGRDVFAPVAAHLAAGGALAEVGPALALDALVRLEASEPTWSAWALRGEVVHVDRFGNLVTNLRLAPDAAAAGSIELGGRALRFVRTYAEAPPRALVALVGSTGRIELAVNGGSAAERTGAGVGRVVVFRAPREPA
jgi:S-adenosylmethionine hydrolase